MKQVREAWRTTRRTASTASGTTAAAITAATRASSPAGYAGPGGPEPQGPRAQGLRAVAAVQAGATGDGDGGVDGAELRRPQPPAAGAQHGRVPRSRLVGVRSKTKAILKLLEDGGDHGGDDNPAPARRKVVALHRWLRRPGQDDAGGDGVQQPDRRCRGASTGRSRRGPGTSTSARCWSRC